MDKKAVKQAVAKRKELGPPRIAALIGALIIIAAFFLPIATATEEHREHLEKYADYMNVEEINMTNEDAIDVSVFDFARMYGVLLDTGNRDLGVLMLIVIAVIAVGSVLALLMAFAKKPIATIIFSVLAMGAEWLLLWDFKDRGVFPGNDYGYGMAYYLYYAGAVVILAGAIWMMITKIKLKREVRAELTENEE